MIQPVKIVAADLEGRYPSGRVLDPDSAQVASLAQEERPNEDVRGLIRPGDRSSPPFDRQCGFSRGDMIGRRVSSASRRGGSQARQLSPLAKDRKLMGFFCFP